MREIFTYGSVGGATGNRCFYPENPTVRDERGACGNVSHGGIRNPLHEPKGCMMETLHLKLSAPYFYPTRTYFHVLY